jgi:hypothetical protein
MFVGSPEALKETEKSKIHIFCLGSFNIYLESSKKKITLKEKNNDIFAEITSMIDQKFTNLVSFSLSALTTKQLLVALKFMFFKTSIIFK